MLRIYNFRNTTIKAQDYKNIYTDIGHENRPELSHYHQSISTKYFAVVKIVYLSVCSLHAYQFN